MITIKRFCLNHVLQHDKILYNTNNHYTERPDDYADVLSRTDTEGWIDKFHKDYPVINIEKKDLYWLKEANKSGRITCKFPKMFEDELEEACTRYEFPEGNWFVRTSRVSLKYGEHGPGPYTNMKSIFESIATSLQGHDCIKEDDNNLRLFLLPWLDMSKEKEFRAFVYNNRVTAISDQHLYSVNNWLNNMSDDEIKDLIAGLLSFFDHGVKDKLVHLNSYTMDIVLLDTGFYFIEANPFGKCYSSGSALFHWINDDEQLHDPDNIEFRYVST